VSEDSILVHRVAIAPIITAACQRLLDRSRPAEEANLHIELGHSPSIRNRSAQRDLSPMTIQSQQER
jgi:hypothetical protein